MSDAPNTSPVVTRSESFRRIHSNLAKYRLGQGEVFITFSVVTEPLISGQIGVMEEAEISLTWIQMKILKNNLNSAIKAIEKIHGKIPEAPKIMSDEEFDLQNEAIVMGLGLSTS